MSVLKTPSRTTGVPPTLGPLRPVSAFLRESHQNADNDLMICRLLKIRVYRAEARVRNPVADPLAFVGLATGDYLRHIDQPRKEHLEPVAVTVVR